MVEKPKTYPQKIQELQDHIAVQNELIAKLQNQVAEIPALRGNIEELESKLAEQVNVPDNKAQMTDLIQRAESAEQGNRNAQQQAAGFRQEIQSLTQQIDVLGHERDKNLGKEAKIQLLAEQLREANLTVSALHQQVRDGKAEREHSQAIQDKELRYLRELTKLQSGKIFELQSAIKALPLDTFSELRRLAGNG